MPDGWIDSTHGKMSWKDGKGKMRLSFFQKYIVFYAYYKSIHLAVIRSPPIFPVR